VRLEGLGKFKKKIHVFGTRTCDPPACSIVPQPTTLPRDTLGEGICDPPACSIVPQPTTLPRDTHGEGI
jgi:hypothetical protein